MLEYKLKYFENLTLHELYRILQLRSEIFVVEQNCVYLDMDDKDQKAYHLLGYDEQGKIHAHCRLLSRGISYDEYSSIGRVTNSAAVRGTGEGKRMMEQAIAETYRLFPQDVIKIGAQSYLKHFYSSLGFEAIGVEYLEDGIPHMVMVHKK